MLELKNISYKVQHTEILKSVSAQFSPGLLNVIIGPNGSGKSTLLKIASGELEPAEGEVYYGDIRVDKMKLKEIAKIRAMLTQQSELNFPLSVAEIVTMGRYPYYASTPTALDRDIVESVLENLNLIALKDRNYLTLSGGEKQRVHYARAMAQLWHKAKDKTRYLLLDEPVSFLDLNFQHEFLKRAKGIAENGNVVIAVLHDINLAAQYADAIYVLSKGLLIAEGPPDKVITHDLIYELYQISCKITTSEDDELNIIIPKKGNNL